jgi:hypothetical protein
MWARRCFGCWVDATAGVAVEGSRRISGDLERSWGCDSNKNVVVSRRHVDSRSVRPASNGVFVADKVSDFQFLAASFYLEINMLRFDKLRRKVMPSELFAQGNKFDADVKFKFQGPLLKKVRVRWKTVAEKFSEHGPQKSAE